MPLFWAKMKLVKSMLRGRWQSAPISQADPSLQEAIGRVAPYLRSYERLAAIYHQYARPFCPDYPSFLRSLSRKHQLPLRSVLDLACGAGTQTERLAKGAERVVGLDLSDEMLADAMTRCAGLANVRFEKADFRQFDLAQQFDAIVCCNDSLNYIAEPAELVEVFRCVRRHLSAPGLFVFDALDDKGFRFYSGKFVPVRIDQAECSMVYKYDPETKVERSLVVFDSGVELHRRIPIEPDQVASAARASGLVLVDWFSVVGMGLIRWGGIRNFYVLKNPS